MMTINCSVPGELGLEKWRGGGGNRRLLQFFLQNRTLERKEHEKEQCRDFLHSDPSRIRPPWRASMISRAQTEGRELETHRALRYRAQRECARTHGESGALSKLLIKTVNFKNEA